MATTRKKKAKKAAKKGLDPTTIVEVTLSAKDVKRLGEVFANAGTFHDHLIENVEDRAELEKMLAYGVEHKPNKDMLVRTHNKLYRLRANLERDALVQHAEDMAALA